MKRNSICPTRETRTKPDRQKGAETPRYSETNPKLKTAPEEYKHTPKQKAKLYQVQLGFTLSMKYQPEYQNFKVQPKRSRTGKRENPKAKRRINRWGKNIKNPTSRKTKQTSGQELDTGNQRP